MCPQWRVAQEKQRRKLALELWLTRGVEDTGRRQKQRKKKWAGNPGHIQDDKNAINLSQVPPALSSDLPFGCVAVFISSGLRTWGQAFAFINVCLLAAGYEVDVMGGRGQCTKVFE